jgi:signal transduction histidine kinase
MKIFADFSADKPMHALNDPTPSPSVDIQAPFTPPSVINILLVDDEPRNLDVLESVLQAPEHNLIRAQTAEEALLLLLEGEFAVIVLDIQMPGMNGIELANLIKQRRRTQHIPIIFLTAYYQEDKDIMEGYGSGAVDYLTKPINPQILKSKIAVFADLFRKTRSLAAVNSTLELEIGQRQKAEEALRQANNELEKRVNERTADLVRLNEELRERESALRISERNALAATHAKDDFIARLSHELRTPLNPVLLVASEAASNPNLPPSIRADFELIAQNIVHEAHLIDDLLDLTRITQGKLSFEMKAIDVHAVLHSALTAIHGEMEQKHIVLTVDFGAASHQVRGDEVRLKQVFWNVLSNAVKFSSPWGKIRVETSLLAGGDRMAVRVTDSGIGMTNEEIARTFQAFCQGDHAMPGGAQKFGGLGLGLSISRKLVELHAGAISATSAGRNQGTTITIELPLHTAESPAGTEAGNGEFPALQGSPLNPAIKRTGRILLVEDHPSTRHALTNLLVRRKYEVLGAACLAEARALAKKEPFDILISDVGLPDGSGNELMKELRGRPGLVGIVLTGYGMNSDVQLSLAAGFAAHITKPVSSQDLDRALAFVHVTAQASA